MTTTAQDKAHRPHAVRLRVSDEELAFLRRVAAEEERTVSNVLRLALRDYVDNRERGEVST